MANDKQASSYRLSAESRRLLAALAAKLGLSMTGVLETAIREKAKRERVK